MEVARTELQKLEPSEWIAIRNTGEFGCVEMRQLFAGESRGCKNPFHGT